MASELALAEQSPYQISSEGRSPSNSSSGNLPLSSALALCGRRAAFVQRLKTGVRLMKFLPSRAPSFHTPIQSLARENKCLSPTGDSVLRSGKSGGASKSISSIPSPTK